MVTKGDIETMRILFGADINELNNQGRWKDAKEMEQIRDRLMEALKDRPTGWIPVSERLPKYNTPVLLALKQIGKERTIVIGERRTRKSGWYFVDIAAYDTEHEVKAWMPLPEPYKTENEE